jgi:hypothetical protein
VVGSTVERVLSLILTIFSPRNQSRVDYEMWHNAHFRRFFIMHALIGGQWTFKKKSSNDRREKIILRYVSVFSKEFSKIVYFQNECLKFIQQ